MYFKTILAISAMALCFASCTKEEMTGNNEGESKVMVFTASQESTAATKAEIDAGDSKVIDWSAGDMISILDGSNNNQFILQSGAGTTQATFSGSAGDASEYVAIYPYQSGLSLEAGKAKGVVLPDVQTATPGTFDPAAGLMMAVSNDKNELNFRNCVTYIKVTTAFPVKNIRFSSLSSVAIAGEMNLTYNEGSPVAEVTNKPAVSVVLVPQGGDTTIPAGTYYIAVLPNVLEEGFKISYVDTDGNGHIRINFNPYTAVRNKVVNMGALDPATYIYNNRQIIYCSTSAYTPYSRSLINGKSPSSSSFNNTFSDGLGIIECLTEDITRTSYLFFNSKSDPDITKVILPETLVEMENSSFRYTSIKTISLPSSLRRLNGTFGSSYLETIIFPEGLEEMITPLLDCTNIEEVYIPSTVTTMDGVGVKGAKRFYGKWATPDGFAVIKDNQLCDFATGNYYPTYEIPSTVTSVRNGLFAYANIGSFTLPDRFTEVPYGFFAYAKLGSISLPEGLTTIDSNAFLYCSCPSVVIPSTVTTINAAAFNWSSIGSLSFAAGSQIKNIGFNAFHMARAYVAIPDGVETIGTQAFLGYTGNQNKIDIIIPDSVTSIGQNAFTSANNVENIIIGANVSSIGRYAFSEIMKHETDDFDNPIAPDQQTDLKSIVCKSVTPPTLASNAFDSVHFDPSFKILVPAESVEAYKTAPGWTAYSSYIEAL